MAGQIWVAFIWYAMCMLLTKFYALFVGLDVRHTNLDIASVLPKIWRIISSLNYINLLSLINVLIVLAYYAVWIFFTLLLYYFLFMIFLEVLIVILILKNFYLVRTDTVITRFCFTTRREDGREDGLGTLLHLLLCV